jgi:hypothetical protein
VGFAKNGDKVVDLAVGAPGDDTGYSSAGALYVLFLESRGAVLETHKIADSPAGGMFGRLRLFDHLGSSVGSFAGFGEIAVGAFRDNDGPGNNLGALYTMSLSSNGSISSVRKISRETGGFDGNITDNARFARSLCILGDLDGAFVVHSISSRDVFWGTVPHTLLIRSCCFQAMAFRSWPLGLRGRTMAGWTVVRFSSCFQT